MRYLAAFALLLALASATAGCSAIGWPSLASQSKGDIERQSESQEVALEAVQKGADISDHAARTATEGNISVIEATARAEAEKLRAEAELAREQQELERIRAENQERIERVRAEIERENLRAEREIAAMEETAERYRAGLRASVPKNTCYDDRLIEAAGVINLRYTEGTVWELAKTGNIVITESVRWDGYHIDHTHPLRICPRDIGGIVRFYAGRKYSLHFLYEN